MWGWCDTRQRSKTKFQDGKWLTDYSASEVAAIAAEMDEAAYEGGATMSLGKRKSSAAGFDPIIKIDCRDGKIARCDRVQEGNEWVTKPEPIATGNFEAVADMPGMRVGWLCFKPPDFQLVKVGEDYGDAPSDKHKEGFRLRVLLRNGAGNGVHELASTAIQMWMAVDELHDAYEAGKAKNKNKLPVIGISEFVRVTTRQGTAYRPEFVIKGWVPAPPELATVPALAKAKRKPKAADAGLVEEA
jgi:hypothetical protein